MTGHYKAIATPFCCQTLWWHALDILDWPCQSHDLNSTDGVFAEEQTEGVKLAKYPVLYQ